MALNNLNNPYSPQPSTPVACAPEDIFPMGAGCPAGVTIMAPVNVIPPGVPVTSIGGGSSGNVISSQLSQSLLVQLQDNQPLRSRHSSAESEPAMRSGMAAPLVLNDGRALGGRFDEPMSSTLAHIQTGWFWSDALLLRSIRL